MTDITLKNLSTEDEISLDAQQIEVLIKEIRSTSGNWLMKIIWRLFPSIWQTRAKDLLELVAPDAEIAVVNNGSISKYQIFARTILVDPTGRPRQFYMGLLILEWLNA
jgi:hypothetical protein